MIEISTPVNPSSRKDNFQASPLQEEGLDEGEQQLILLLAPELTRISRNPNPLTVEQVLEYSRRTLHVERQTSDVKRPA